MERNPDRGRQFGGIRFEEVYIQGKLNVTKVIRNNETGVLYMAYQEGSGMGLTAMLDQDGPPLVDKEL
ncbi:DUF6440 family protein [Lentibacillus halophilus]|uniref:DUF6440 family protein n=1 Tax=Lentibacillus halophilus TaxID=295065 RepID=UPI0031D1374C